MSVTLKEIKEQARQRADMENSTFIKETELTLYVNSSISELYDILVQTYQDYYIDEYEFKTTSQVSSYPLPEDFYKLRGVDARLGSGDYIALKQFNFNERTAQTSLATWGSSITSDIRYRILADKIKFVPVPDTNADIRIWYTPSPKELKESEDIFPIHRGYIEYVVVDVAIKMLQKEESDVSVLMNQKANLKRRIEEVAGSRDTGDSESITDVYQNRNLIS